MDFYKDKKFIFMVALVILAAAGLAFFPRLSGLILIGSLIVFGAFALSWKEPHIKLSGMALLVLLALLNIYVNGVKFGIDFSGGTRIPVILDKAVDDATMGDLVQTIKTRASVLGLTEVKVQAIGNTEINVEIPSSDEETVRLIETTLSHQGVYQGIVDGKLAVSGDRIFSSSIKPLDSAELTQQGADWGVAFAVDQAGAEQFAQSAKGKADYPIYMYLDRPHDVAIFYERVQFHKDMMVDAGEKESLKALNDALKFEGDSIPVYIVEDMGANFSAPNNHTKAIVSANMSQAGKDSIAAKGFILDVINASQITPTYSRTRSGVLMLEKLEISGLLTAPILSGGITNGIPNYNYVVTGSVQATTATAKALEAQNRVKEIESILKGGSLPVQISLGSRTSLPASLGAESLRLSVIAIVLSLLVIAILIGLRYRDIAATLPIVLISLAEFIILVSILGSFTIDLAAMAGILAAIGVGVDAQIVITDELLKKDDEHKTSEKIDLAFGIIKTNAIVAIFSMVPLLFSGLVEVIGFAISTILGALLGYLLTRPAYAALVEKVLDAEKKGISGGSGGSENPPGIGF